MKQGPVINNYIGINFNAEAGSFQPINVMSLPAEDVKELARETLRSGQLLQQQLAALTLAAPSSFRKANRPDDGNGHPEETRNPSDFEEGIGTAADGEDDECFDTGDDPDCDSDCDPDCEADCEADDSLPVPMTVEQQAVWDKLPKEEQELLTELRQTPTLDDYQVLVGGVDRTTLRDFFLRLRHARTANCVRQVLNDMYKVFSMTACKADYLFTNREFLMLLLKSLSEKNKNVVFQSKAKQTESYTALRRFVREQILNDEKA